MIYLVLLSASLIWGINVIVMKVILEFIPVYFLAMLKVGISLISIYVVMKLKKVSLEKIDFKTACKVSLFALTINFVFTFTGMKVISGTGNAILNALAPMVTILLSLILLKHKVEKRQYVAMIIALIGFLYSIHFDFKQLSWGHILLLAGIISYSYANILMQKTRNSDNYLPFTFGYLFLGFFELLFITLLVERNVIMTITAVPVSLWILFILFSGIGFAYIQVVYLYSLKRLGSIKTSFFLSLNPLFTYVTALLFLKETISIHLLLSFILMMLALLIANRIVKKKELMDFK